MNRGPTAIKPPRANVRRAFVLLTFTAAVLRAEVTLFIVPLALHYLLFNGVGFFELLKIGGLASLASVGKRHMHSDNVVLLLTHVSTSCYNVGRFILLAAIPSVAGAAQHPVQRSRRQKRELGRALAFITISRTCL